MQAASRSVVQRRAASYSILKFRKSLRSVILFNERKSAMLTGHWMLAEFCCVIVLQILLLRSDAYLRAALVMCSDALSFGLCVKWFVKCRRTSAAARLLRLWVRILPVAWMFVCCGSCVLSGRGLCHDLITLSEDSYRMWCVVVCDQETTKNHRE